MKPEHPLKSGFLADAFTRWRKVVGSMQKAGVVKKAQKEYHRLCRRKNKESLRNEDISNP